MTDEMTDETREALINLGLEMVRITTTVRGFDEWPAIPELWLNCMRERDRLRTEVENLESEIRALNERLSEDGL